MSIGIPAPVDRSVRSAGGFASMSLDALYFLVTRPLSWREVVRQAWFITRVSIVPTILVMLGFTLLVIFQVNLLLQDLGALDLAGAIAAIASVQQIGPFVTVVVVAGAGGTAICADLGARTIREEIDAMRVLGIDPVARLVVPRLVACVVVTLLLNLVIASGGLIGGFFFSVHLQNVSPAAYVNSVSMFTGIPELGFSMFKAFVFGVIAGLIACYRGLNASGGSKGVGDAVNQAVVVTVAVLVPVSLSISIIQFAVL